MNNYDKAIHELLNYYSGLNYECINIDEYSNVFIIEDSLLLYVENVISNDPYNTGVHLSDGYGTLYIQELTYNDFIKFNKSEFDRKIKNLKLFTYYVRFKGLESYSYQREKDIVTKVNRITPELHLNERYNQWNGFYYNIVIMQMKSIDNKNEYAIYVTHKKPLNAVQKIVNELITKDRYELIQNGFSVEDYHFFMNGKYMYGFDFIDAYFSHKNERKKVRLEENLKYYYINEYFKENKDIVNYCNKLLKKLYTEIQIRDWTSYVFPTYKWKNEEFITKVIQKNYKEYGVVSQYRPFWLKSSFGGQMSYDIYISKLRVAIEYQGEQHFQPVEYFGGKESFEKVQQRDEEKRNLSKEYGIKLVYINYWEDITEKLIIEKITNAINN